MAKKKLKSNLLNLKHVIIAIILLTIIFELTILLKNANNTAGLKNITETILTDEIASKISSEIILKCEKAPHKPSCYDKEIPKLMDPPINLSMENAFNITKLVQDKDSTYQYCHILGHELSAKEVKKDPSKWKDVVARCPSGVCSNGCIHGGFQEKFRKESLTDKEIPKIIPDLNTICEKKTNWNPTQLEQASCYHALGHLTMYITQAKINKAIDLCNVISIKKDGRDYSQLCYDGVFMQIFQPLEPEDFALVKGKQPSKNSLLSFCNNYMDKKRASCISESWPLFLNELLSSSDNIVKFCSMEEEDQKEKCYHSVFYVITAELNLDFSKMKSLCEGLPQNIRPLCFTDAASRLIETDYRNINKSVEICNSATQFDPDNICFKMLLQMSKYNFHANSSEFTKLCNALPNQWKSKCFE